jgi:hypothetical protein
MNGTGSGGVAEEPRSWYTRGLEAMNQALRARAATLLAETRDSWKGALMPVFQPAEETGTGAQAIVDGGLVPRFQTRRHSWPACDGWASRLGRHSRGRDHVRRRQPADTDVRAWRARSIPQASIDAARTESFRSLFQRSRVVDSRAGHGEHDGRKDVEKMDQTEQVRGIDQCGLHTVRPPSALALNPRRRALRASPRATRQSPASLRTRF